MTRTFGFISACFLLFCVSAIRASDKPATNGSINPAWNATWVDKLKRHLLLNYDKFARPVQHTHNITVNVSFSLNHIDFDEMKSIMEVHAWVRFLWKDEKLKWNVSDFGDLAVLHVGDHEIWQPDIVLYNSAAGSSIDHYGNTHCLIYPNGNVMWVPPTQFLVFCTLNLRLWPFDTQVCKIVVGSWTYSGEQIDLVLPDKPIEHIFSIENTEWTLLNSSVVRRVKLYECCTEPYVSIDVTVTLKRQSATYSAIVLTPATVIILMTLTVFWLPPQSGEKILLGGCTAIIISLFLLYFSQKIKSMAFAVPLVVLFYSNSLYLVCFSLVISVVVINISRKKHNTSIPWFFKSILRGPIGSILLLGYNNSKNSSHDMSSRNTEEMRDGQGDDSLAVDDRQMISHQIHSNSQHDWITLATALDRIVFLLYCLMFIIFSISYSI